MAVPSGKHTDLPWPLSLIPRKLTAIPSNTPPHKVAHSPNLTNNGDVPNPGAWNLSMSKYGVNFAATTKGGWHFRIGTFRFDFVDHYYEVPLTFTIKKLKEN